MWTDFRNGPGNNAIVGLPQQQHKDAAAYRVKLSGLIWGSAVGDGEFTYVGTTKKRFYCIDKAGAIRWTYKLTMKGDSLIDSAAAIDPALGIVVVPGGDGFLHALDMKSGALRWRFEAYHDKGDTVNSFEGNVKIDSKGSRVYAGCDDNWFYCLDGRSGQEIWSFETGMMIWTCPCLFDDCVAIGSLDFHVYVLRAQDGKLLAKLNTGAEVKSSIVYHSDAFVACNSNGVVFCWNASSFKEVWRKDCGSEIYSTPVITPQGHIITSTMDGDVVCLNSKDGAMIWKVSLNCAICASGLVVNDTYFVGGQSGVFFGVLCETGQVVVRCPLSMGAKSALNASPTMDTAGNIIVGGYDSHLYILPHAWLLRQGLGWKDATDGLPDGLYVRVHENMRFIKKIELLKLDNGVVIPNAAFSADKVSLPIELRRAYDIVVSSDGRFINLICKNPLLPQPKGVFKIKSKYFMRTTNWITDRLVYQGESAFEFTITLSGDGGAGAGAHLPAYSRFLLSSMYCQQPRILDTYIPAAIDAQGFLGVLLESDDGVVYPMVCFSVIPDEDGFVLQKDMSKTLMMKAIYYRETNTVVVENKNPFVISAMGGTIPMTKFKLFVPLDTGKGEFAAEAFCPSIKGNDSSYKFSKEIIPLLCDYRMRLISEGTVDVERLGVDDDTGVIATERDGVVSVHGGRDAYLVTVVLYTPNRFDDTVIHQTIITDGSGIRVVFSRDWRALHKKYAVLVNGAVVSRGF
jgi:outer membrane protein assembly factor BamB